MGYSRHVRGKKAVSPVVATLILILIAVAAAAALYLWLVAWQGGVTHGIGSPSAQYTVSIGGSTSVYPLAELAATQFEQNNSDVVISVNQGGTGAGMAAVCSGQIDIGEASAFEPVSTLQSADGCPSTTVEEIIAYDGVDIIVPQANVHGLQSMSYDTLQSIFVLGNTATGTTISGSNLCTNGVKNPANGGCTEDGASIQGLTVSPAGKDSAGQTGLAWDQIPACAAAATACFNAGTSASPINIPETNLTDAVALATTGSSVFSPSGALTATTAYTGSVTFTLASGATYVGTAVPAGLALTGGGVTWTTGPTITGYSQSGTTLTVDWSGETNAASTGLTGGAVAAGDYYVQGAGGTQITIGTAAAACGSTPDLCAAAFGATAFTAGTSPCGFTVCAGGAAAGTGAGDQGALIFTLSRSDVSGTEQSFGARLLAVGASGGTPQGVGFSGCSGDNQLDGCGLASDAVADGNPGVIQAVAGDKDAIGFASDGLVQATGSGVSAVSFQGYGQSVVVTMPSLSQDLKNIAAGIAAYNSGAWSASAQAYIGWRPFINVETAPPTGEVLRYLEFVMDPANNQNLANEAAEISVYASGLAGVVPVTPIP